MTHHILSVGTSVPRYQVDFRAGARFAATTSGIGLAKAKQVTALYRRSGIVTRGSVLLESNPEPDVVNDFYPPAESPDDRGPSTKLRNDRYSSEAPLLALEAAESALERSDVSADSVTHLVTVSCTGFNAPGIDIALIDGLGLPADTQRVQIGFMGCHGAINGLRAAIGLLSAEPGSTVLVCCVELCSLHFQYGQETDRIVTGALFADGAGAVVLHGQGDGSGGFLSDRERSNGRQAVGPDSISPESIGQDSIGQVQATGSHLVPGSRDAMTWQIGDNGYLMTLSAQVPDLIESHLHSYLERWLAKQGETLASIGGWAVHPGGKRILTAVETALKLDESDLETSRAVLSEHGNMSSATMLFILERFAAIEMPKPWLMLGFGPGLEIEVALIR